MSVTEVTSGLWGSRLHWLQVVSMLAVYPRTMPTLKMWQELRPESQRLGWLTTGSLSPHTTGLGQDAWHGGNTGHLLFRFLEMKSCPAPHPAYVVPTVILGPQPSRGRHFLGLRSCHHETLGGQKLSYASQVIIFPAGTRTRL